MMDYRQNYIQWHILRVFFEDYDKWSEVCREYGFTGSLTKYEYDDLLKGTDANIYIPLWTSACVGSDEVLLNETTLEVIKHYRKNGYSPVRMDGNPPDYIGEECRFMEYLFRGMMENEKCGAASEADVFLDMFLTDTVAAFCNAAASLTSSEDVMRIVRLLRASVSGSAYIDVSDIHEESFDSFGWILNEAVDLEEPRKVSMSSYSDCGNKCKVLATVQEGCVLGIEFDRSYDRYFTGCPRGLAYRQTFLSSRRLRYPMERIAERGEGKFRRISWEEAASKIAAEIKYCGKEFGPASRYVMAGAGVCAAVCGSELMRQVLHDDGGCLAYYNTYSIACAEYMRPYIYGNTVCGNDESDLLNSRLIILWGHNPANTHWGNSQNNYLLQAKQKGIKIIVIDPRRSETAKVYGDQWIPVRPSTDGALADAIAYTIWSRGLQDQAFMDRFCIGFDEEHMPEGVPYGESYHSYLFGIKDGIVKDAAWASEITGIPEEVIIELAVEYACAKPACLIPGLSLNRTMNGEQNVRACAMLACLTGNVGKSGGSAGYYQHKKGHITPYYIASQNPYPGSIPCFRWSLAADRPEEINEKTGLRGASKLDGGLKLVFGIASGMIVNQHSNINDTIRILKEKDKIRTLVIADIFMTPGARFADILLPCTSFFESDNIVGPWGANNYLLYNHKAIDPLFGCRFEYDWIGDVAAEMGTYESYTHGAGSLDEQLKNIYDQLRTLEKELPSFELFRESSCYIYRDNGEKVALTENIAGGEPFDTPSGKIEIFSKRLYDMNNPQLIPGVPSYTPCTEGYEQALQSEYPIQLIGYHTKRRCHSIHDNNKLLENIDLPGVIMNIADASQRGIKNGDMVDVFNVRGRVRVPAKVSGDIMRGVAALSEGAWYTPDAFGVDVRGSINVLTLTHEATPIANGNPQHTNLVQIEKTGRDINR